ncbi:hypothetical protein [Sporolactobacillus pectinivorans]|uniref:hypothetical protein n=1 Tax=Sporolactobacillus pectinivorans TaxID=1591408 RepID=UPI000C268F03|nr:hypothetical protein [Sporolactobacillus pectinivorans]
MYSWRITKYDPAKRNPDGSYGEPKEWTSFSDVGESVDEGTYLQTEENYLQTIKAFMNELDITEVYVGALEENSHGNNVQNGAIDFLKIWQGKKISAKEAMKLARLTLREKLWCKLIVPEQFFVHFGYDYHLYIGAYKDCPQARKKAEMSGLYVENFRSPYL